MWHESGMRSRLARGLAIAVVLASASGDGRAAGRADPGVAPFGSHPHGHSYAAWQAEWLRWALLAPAAVNPILDETGEHCADGQSGHVWFLAGNFGGTSERSCTIPTGTALYFPLINYWWVQFLTDPPATVEELRAIIATMLDGAVVAAEVDGVPVAGAADYRGGSTAFTADFTEGNIMGVGATECAPGTDGLFHCAPSVGDGIYLMLEPLSRGEHTLHFTASHPSGFALDVTYHLHVGG